MTWTLEEASVSVQVFQGDISRLALIACVLPLEDNLVRRRFFNGVFATTTACKPVENPFVCRVLLVMLRHKPKDSDCFRRLATAGLSVA